MVVIVVKTIGVETSTHLPLSPGGVANLEVVKIRGVETSTQLPRRSRGVANVEVVLKVSKWCCKSVVWVLVLQGGGGDGGYCRRVQYWEFMSWC